MTKESNIKDELLKQLDTGYAEPRISEKIIFRNTVRVRRLKWITVICWFLVVFFFLVAGIIELNVKGIESDTLYMSILWGTISTIVSEALLLIAIVLTISFFIRSRSLTLQQIQSRLAGIEEQLKTMSQKD